MDAIENVLAALRMVIHLGVVITVRYEHPRRPTMASYRTGVPIGLYTPGWSNPVNAKTAPEFWPALVMPNPQFDPEGERIPLDWIEQIEIEGGLRTARVTHGRKGATILPVPIGSPQNVGE